MLQYLMESCVLFDYMVIYLFQGYYLILNCKKVPGHRREKKKKSKQIPYFRLESNIDFLVENMIIYQFLCCIVIKLKLTPTKKVYEKV